LCVAKRSSLSLPKKAKNCVCILAELSVFRKFNTFFKKKYLKKFTEILQASSIEKQALIKSYQQKISDLRKSENFKTTIFSEEQEKLSL
jgi:hypothetical protein